MRLHIALLTVISSVAMAAEVTTDVDAVVRGNNDFAAKLYRVAAGKDGNICFSPLNISHALAMLLAGARGETAREIANAMSVGLPAERFHPAFASLLGQLDAGPKPYDLLIAARLWGEKQYPFAGGFLSLVERNYGGGLESVEFSRNTEAARRVINAWVAGKTKGHIEELLSDQSLDSQTRLVLTSAIYFKAAWAVPFETRNTKADDFHLSASNKIKVPMMKRAWSRVDYFATPEVRGVALPYQGGELSMVVLMPGNVDGLAALEKGFSAEQVQKWMRALRPHDVDLALPRFRFSQKQSLREGLSQLGMKKAFREQEADLSGMLQSGKRSLFVSNAAHKAFIDVNERGTEATAATGVVAAPVMAYPTGVFHADRPFLF